LETNCLYTKKVFDVTPKCDAIRRWMPNSESAPKCISKSYVIFSIKSKCIFVDLCCWNSMHSVM